MTDVLFRFDVEAAPEVVRKALTTSDGIKAFWTSEAVAPAEVGGTLEVSFKIAPAPFDLRLEQSDERTIVWRTMTFPPHWVGTSITWNIEPNDAGTTVGFRHGGFTDEDEAGRVAYTWGQVMLRLTEYVKTGRPNPVFT